MSELNTFDDAAWDRFFEFLYPTGEKLPGSSIDDELKAAVIDVTVALQKVRKAILSADAKRRLELAKGKRSRLLDQLRSVTGPAIEQVREGLANMIEQKLVGSKQATYFKKLNNAASDDDLRSLLEDLERLDCFEPRDDDTD